MVRRMAGCEGANVCAPCVLQGAARSRWNRKSSIADVALHADVLFSTVAAAFHRTLTAPTAPTCTCSTCLTPRWSPGACLCTGRPSRRSCRPLCSSAGGYKAGAGRGVRRQSGVWGRCGGAAVQAGRPTTPAGSSRPLHPPPASPSSSQDSAAPPPAHATKNRLARPRACPGATHNFPSPGPRTTPVPPLTHRRHSHKSARGLQLRLAGCGLRLVCGARVVHALVPPQGAP